MKTYVIESEFYLKDYVVDITDPEKAVMIVDAITLRPASNGEMYVVYGCSFCGKVTWYNDFQMIHNSMKTKFENLKRSFKYDRTN